MDNQTNPQEPVNQALPQEEIIPQEPVIEETPILETQAPEPKQVIQETPERESEPEIQSETEVQSEAKILLTGPTVPSEEYQKIIDDYKKNTQPESEPIEAAPEPKQVIQETPERESEPEIQPETRADVQTQPKSPEEQLQDLGITTPPKTGGGFLKGLFVFSLVIFVLVLAALGFFYFKNQNNSDSLNNNVSEITPTPISTDLCSLNDKTYQIGESFPSTDGCNTCTCESINVITCTEKACAPIPTSVATNSANKLTITPTKTATSSVKKTTSTATPSSTIE
jgi:hypothetical protein